MLFSRVVKQFAQHRIRGFTAWIFAEPEVADSILLRDDEWGGLD